LAYPLWLARRRGGNWQTAYNNGMNTLPKRTRIKFCGLTRVQDVRAAIEGGADALGFVFYVSSSRYIVPAQAAVLMQTVPAMVSKVGLFVNASTDDVVQAVHITGVDLLQFHGDETPQFCEAAARAAQRPYMRAISVAPHHTSADLLHLMQSYPNAKAFLFDTASTEYGGSGKTFEWSVLQPLAASPANAPAPPLILSGGLSAQNAADAIKRVRPFAVDVSSSIESAKGIKDAQKIAEFAAAVRAADQF
jgi:phosphoribosylanthranilate isomerase